MNLRSLIVPMLVALAISFGLNYFFSNKIQQPLKDTERSRVAPKIEEINIPLNMNVIFAEPSHEQPVVTVVDTPYAELTFTSAGAAIDKIIMKHDVDGTSHMMQTFEAIDANDKCFLLALEDKTPFSYRLVDKQEDDTIIKLVYQAEEPLKIIKEFSIYKTMPKIDLEIDIAGVTEQSPVRARLLFPSPYVIGLKDEAVRGLVNDGKSIAKKTIDVVKEGRYWETPTLVGSEDRYFICAMTSDANNFVQRAYFKLDQSARTLTSILDSGLIKTNGAYALSFYIGAKRLSLMQKVDSRLTGTLEYGWLEPLCVPMMYVLNKLYDVVHNYGWAIVLLTILMKLVLLPFAWRGQSRMQKGAKQQKEFQAKLNYLKEKYKDDKERLQQEQAELIRKHGMPGAGGCLPLLVQVPVFFALQRILNNSVELYKAPFLWISDLSSADPYYILPVLVVIGMIASGMGMSGGQGKMFDPRAKLAQIAFGVIMGAIMLHLSSGVVLYMALSTLLTVLQNALQMRVQRRA